MSADAFERSFVRRVFLLFCILTTWIWVYNEWVARNYTSDAIGQLEHLQDFSPEQQAEIKNAAFSAIRTPHFFSGIQIPSTLVPSSDPVLSGVAEDEVIGWFSSGAARTIVEHGRTVPESRKWVTRAREKALSSAQINAISQRFPAFANTLWFINQGFFPERAPRERLQLCRQTPSCVGHLLYVRHPNYYNALIALTHYANGRPLSKATIEFSGRRPGFFIRARALASERGHAPAVHEEKALLRLQRLQLRGVRSMRTMAIFFTGAALSVFVLALWSRRRHNQATL